MTTSIRNAASALGGEITGRNKVRCPGPGHSRKDRSLAVTFSGDGFVVHSFAGDDWKECRDYVKAALGLPNDRPTPLREAPEIDVDRLGRQKTAAEIWARSVPIAGSLAEAYLASRGLAYNGDGLRFYPGGRAIIALITDAISNAPIGVHRTFLDRDGRRVGKRMLGTAKGGVVRLCGDDEVTTGLGIAEGIETALAAPYRPIWACLSAGGMERFPVLSGIECLTIFADNDATGTGQQAANVCGRRWHTAGREVEIIISDATGKDMADEMQEAA